MVHKVSWPTWREAAEQCHRRVRGRPDHLLPIVFLMDFIFGVQNMSNDGFWKRPARGSSTNDRLTMAEVGTRHWYVLRAHQRKEKKVKELLEMEIAKAGLGTYIRRCSSRWRSSSRIRDGKKVRERNLYPGYVLLEADLTGRSPTTSRVCPTLGFLGAEKSVTQCPAAQQR